MVLFAGCGGNTLGPYIFAESSPAAFSAGVADLLRFEPHAQARAEQLVLGVLREKLRRNARRLL